jgi:hypothetical protein
MNKPEFQNGFGRNHGRYGQVNEETRRIQFGKMECEQVGEQEVF